MRVLILLDYYLPGFKGGGPAKSIFNLISHLNSLYEFSIITSDRDLGDSSSYSNVTHDKWMKFDDVKIFYASPKSLNFFNLLKIIRNHNYDIIYINSFFSFTFAIQPLLGALFSVIPREKILLAPRGELEAGCLEVKSNKKRLFLFFSKTIRLYDNLKFQATSKHEVTSIKKVLKNRVKNIVISENLGPKALPGSFNQNKPRTSEMPLRICFFSRITREKNLNYALDIIKAVVIPIKFDIYGTNHEDEKYWSICKKKMKSINEKSIEYMGSLKPNEVNNMFKNYDLFFFPTKGENYGHVIIESLSAGTPVLIADTTPWRNLEIAGVGWDVPLDKPELFIDKINNLYSLSPLSYIEMRKKALNFAIRVGNDKDILNNAKNLFN
ncbi:MAG: glycosyltransferase [Bacteroidetes bacterium]|nr:glycosyltransferase [Bacteroidota bacterium]